MSRINEIVDEFSQKLLADEDVSVESYLKKYPKLAKKLKIKLEIERLLVQAGKAERAELEQVMKVHKPALWQILEQKLQEKQKLEWQKRMQAMKDAVRIKHRADFILLFLYIKGKSLQFNESIRGVTRLIKLLFLMEKETDLVNYTQSYYNFIPYKLGPFDPKVYQDLKILEMADLVVTRTYKFERGPFWTDREIDEGFTFNDMTTHYSLSEKGLKFASGLLKWLHRQDQTSSAKLHILKSYYAQAPLKQLLKYVYAKYPEYTTESEVIEEILK